MARLVILGAFLALASGFVYIIRVLPWWGSVLFFVGTLLFMKVVLGKLVAAAFKAPFRAKGAVLHDARVVVHEIRPAAAPSRASSDESEVSGESEETDVTEREGWRWFLVDLTVEPKPRTGGFSHWEPGELMFVSKEARAESFDDEAEVAEIHDVRIWREESFQTDEEGKYEGPQRLEIHAAIAPNTSEVKLRYYFESLADLKLPAV